MARFKIFENMHSQSIRSGMEGIDNVLNSVQSKAKNMRLSTELRAYLCLISDLLPQRQYTVAIINV